MDRKIFGLGLTTEAVSAYIIIDALENEALRPALSLIRPRWNGSDDEFQQALSELLGLRVVARAPDSGEADPVYRTNPAHRWGPAAPWPPPTGLPVFSDD